MRRVCSRVTHTRLFLPGVAERNYRLCHISMREVLVFPSRQPITLRCAFSSAAHCFCGLTVRRCGHSLCVLNFSRFLARLCDWYSIAALPCFSASGEVPVTRCGLPLLGTYAAYLVGFPLRLSHAHARLRPASISSAAVRSWQGGLILTRSFQRALSFPCRAHRYAPTLSGRYPAYGADGWTRTNDIPPGAVFYRLSYVCIEGGARLSELPDLFRASLLPADHRRNYNIEA